MQYTCCGIGSKSLIGGSGKSVFTIMSKVSDIGTDKRHRNFGSILQTTRYQSLHTWNLRQRRLGVCAAPLRLTDQLNTLLLPLAATDNSNHRIIKSQIGNLSLWTQYDLKISKAKCRLQVLLQAILHLGNEL